MTPELPDAERDRRLSRLREGQVELNAAEQQVLEAVRALQQLGEPVSTRTVWDRLRGQVSKHKVEDTLRRLAEQGALESDTPVPADSGRPGPGTPRPAPIAVYVPCPGAEDPKNEAQDEAQTEAELGCPARAAVFRRDAPGQRHQLEWPVFVAALS
jgi:hypothetical protein